MCSLIAGVESPCSPTSDVGSCNSPSSSGVAGDISLSPVNESKRRRDSSDLTTEQNCETATDFKKQKFDDGDSSEDYDSEDDDGEQAEKGTSCLQTSARNIETVKRKQSGKPCLLKATIFIKLVNNQVVLELNVLGGLLSKDAGNQLVTLFRNKLQKQDIIAT